MKCRYSENDVALYVEGDLQAGKVFEFEAHLAAQKNKEAAPRLDS